MEVSQSRRVLDELNHRFANGMRRLDDAAEAGVFVMAFNDRFGFADRRWELYDFNCTNLMHRGSGSIMNKELPFAMRNLCKGAFILSPDFVRRSIRCAYQDDANSLNSKDGCGQARPCSASRVGDCLRRQFAAIRNKSCPLNGTPPNVCYNEVVFNAQGAEGFYGQLPQAVQAWVVDDHKWRANSYGTAWKHFDCESQPGEVRWEHASFLIKFNVSEEQIPLVYFDRSNLDAPFYLGADWRRPAARVKHGHDSDWCRGDAG